MNEIGHILWHSFTDTIVLVPLLVVVYFLIELLEYKNVFKFEKSKLLNGKASPAIGALFGSVPQCGFSVISAELYAKKKISVAALIAVFIATSDEALPILISDISNIPSLLMLIAVKIVLAIIIGYLTMFFYKVIFKKQSQNIKIETPAEKSEETLEQKDSKTIAHAEDHKEDKSANNHDEHDKITDETHTHEDESENSHSHSHVHACCHHDLNDNKFDWKHPLVHSAKITLYIFIINIIMNTLIEFVGEDSITAFLQTSFALQPIVALLVGLIPNCVSSVVLTELYVMGGLSFGAVVTGLSVNAGLGLLVLFKENKNVKENLFIVAMLIIPSLIFGYALHFIPFDFLRI